MTTFSVQTAATRQILGRVHRGRGLQDALGEIVAKHELTTAWISALGAFEWVDLTEYDQTTQQYAKAGRFERCELLALQGNLSERDGAPFWHLHATISRREGGRDVAYGGHLVDGLVFALEFRIQCFDELSLSRAHDEPTGLQLWTDPSQASEGAAPQPSDTSVTWAMAAQVSSGMAPPSEEATPTKGDWLEHPKFGLCRIDGLSGDGVCIIKLADARRKKIQIGALEILAPRNDGSRLIFPVRPKAKR